MTSVLCPRIRVMPTCPLTFLADPSVTGKDPREGNSLPQFLIIFYLFSYYCQHLKKVQLFLLKKLCGVLHRAESSSPLCIPLQSQAPRCDAHRRVKLRTAGLWLLLKGQSG